MIQRIVIEEFLKELLVKLGCSDDESSFWAEENETVQFVRDWLQEHKGEL